MMDSWYTEDAHGDLHRRGRESMIARSVSSSIRFEIPSIPSRLRLERDGYKISAIDGFMQTRIKTNQPLYTFPIISISRD